MATNFPGSLDAFTNPIASDTLDNPPHDEQHADINDAMEAVQAKLGVGAHTIGERSAFTPSWTNLTPGAATETWHYVRVNDFVSVVGSTVFAADTSVTGLVEMDLPVGTQGAAGGVQHGICRFFDTGGLLAIGGVQMTSTKAGFYPYTAGGTYVARGSGMNTTYPFTWATGDALTVEFVYHIA